MNKGGNQSNNKNPSKQNERNLGGGSCRQNIFDMEAGDSDKGEGSDQQKVPMVFGFVNVEFSMRQEPQDQSHCPHPTARTTPKARGCSGQDCAPGN